MSKECKTARNAVLIPIVVLLAVLMFCSSCASTCQCTQSYSYKNRNNCPAYRQNGSSEFDSHLSTKINKYEENNNNIISNVCTTIVWNVEMGGTNATKRS